MPLDTANALVTLNETRDFLKISEEVEDGVIENIINQSSEFANTYTRRKLKSRAVTEYYDGDGSDTLIFLNYPVTALTSIHDDVSRSFAGSSLIPVSDYVLDGTSGILRFLNGRVSSEGRANIKVVGTVGLATIPADLREAVLLICEHTYRRLYQDQRVGVASETIGEKTTQFTADPIPPRSKLILAHYTSTRVWQYGF